MWCLLTRWRSTCCCGNAVCRVAVALRRFRNYKSGIQRADAFRYFVLFAYGGIYVDLDMEALKPLDEYVAMDLPKTTWL